MLSNGKANSLNQQSDTFENSQGSPIADSSLNQIFASLSPDLLTLVLQKAPENIFSFLHV